MKKISLFFTLSLCLAISFAQTNNTVNYAGMINAENLKKHLTIIAGDEMEGRETGTEGQRRAAAYIETQFKNLGLTAPPSLNGYQQFYPLYIDSITGSVVKINNKVLKFGIDYFLQVTNNDSKNLKGKKMVFVGYGISEKNYDDYKGLDVKGKIVVLFLGEPKNNGNYLVSGTSKYSKYTYPGIRNKIETAQQKGALAAIVINPAMEVFSSSTIKINSQSGVYYPDKGDKINYINLSHEAAKKIFVQWNMDSLLIRSKTSALFTTVDIKPMTIACTFNYTKTKQLVNASNVIGVIEGTDKKDEFVLLTGHYDHLGKKDGKIYYGADDDGSGTCAVLEMAAAFAKAKAAGNGPRRTIVFMTVSGEEKGLWGSEYYCDHPVFPLEKTSVDLNTDMVGRIDTERKTGDTLNYVYVIGHDKVSSELQAISEGENNKNTQLVLDYRFDEPNDPYQIYLRSDHYNFARKGVPILFFYDGMLQADYHKPTDTIDKIYWALYEKRVRMIFHTAWSIANRDEMLKRDLPLSEVTR